MRAKQSKRPTFARLLAILSSVAMLSIAGVTITATAAVAGGGAGTNIGNATNFSGTVTGSLTSSLSDDWWVVYPTTVGGVVNFDITNTTADGTQACTTLDLSIENTNGTAIQSGSPGPSGTFIEPESSPNSDRYYVELNTGGCGATAGNPVTYSLEETGAGSGPVTMGGTIAAGDSIGAVGAPLQGGAIYSGAVTTGTPDNWYVLYKANDTNNATIRIENTTVSGSSNCQTFFGSIDGSGGNGNIISYIGSQDFGLGNNTAVTYSYSAAGEYYIEINDGGCTPTNGPTTYSIETEPASEWTTGPTPPAPCSVASGDSIGAVGSPLQGGTICSGAVTTGTSDNWYVLYKANDTNNATIRIENTTVSGSSNCQTFFGSIDGNGGNGNIISYIGSQDFGLGNNSAVTYSYSAAGEYYIEIYDGGCTPTSGPTTYSIETEPGSEWITGPTPPAPCSIASGDSIGAVRSPLQGGTICSGAVTTGTSDNWYVLYKANDTNNATIRIENTTVSGSSNCQTFFGSIDGSGGSVINYIGSQDFGLGNNSAVTYSYSAAGVYYIEIYDGGCTPTNGPTTYSIETEPASEWSTGDLVPLVPSRLLDTRIALGASGPLAAGKTLSLAVDGRGGVPASGVGAVVLNVTVTQPGAAGYLTVWPDGVTQPTASNLNFSVGETIPNLVIAPVGADGKVDIYNGSTATVQLIADVSGYYYASATPAPGGLAPLTPSRLLDTRNGTGASGPLASKKTLVLAVDGHGGVPLSGVGAVVLNVTVTQPGAAGYLTVWPDGVTQPTASNLNFSVGETIPNLVIAPVGADGKVDIYNGSTGSVQLIADVSGYFEAGTPVPGGLSPLTPSRLLDTRSNIGATGPVAPKATVTLTVVGAGGVPATGVGAVVLNVTVTQPGAVGYLTVWPDATAQPNASNLNFTAGETIPNLVIAPVGADGKVDIYNGSTASVQIIADVSGYFSTD